MAEIKYEIVQEICVLSESARGWTKELNLVSWNDREPKFDIRGHRNTPGWARVLHSARKRCR